MSARAKKTVRGGYRISAVARLTGVSAHSLRVWERRYDSLSSGRSDGGYRLYTNEDVLRIGAIKTLLDRGHPIGQLVELSRDELEKMRGEIETPPEPSLVALPELTQDRFLSALGTLDLDACERALSGAALALEPMSFMTQIAGPLLTEIGKRWSSGELTVAQEHAATTVLRAQLVLLLRGVPHAKSAPVLVATTPEGEAHELGAMLASVVAALHGCRVVYLGPSLPAAEIADAARRSVASFVLLSIVAMEPRRARRAVTDVRNALPRKVVLLVGGGAVRSELPGATWTQSLEALGATLDQAISRDARGLVRK